MIRTLSPREAKRITIGHVRYSSCDPTNRQRHFDALPNWREEI
ncbi:MAG: hypothetical protein ACK5Q5_23110 [Planctomycetaceae bacterium]